MKGKKWPAPRAPEAEADNTPHRPVCRECGQDDVAKFSSKQRRNKEEALCSKCSDREQRIYAEEMRRATKERRALLREQLDSLPVYTVDIPPGRVHWVDDMTGLTVAEPLLRQCSIAGIDTEARPTFGKGEPNNPTSLVQIAVRLQQAPSSPPVEHVLLFDMNNLTRQSPCRAKVFAMLSDLFLNAQITKLGLSLEGDVLSLLGSHGCEEGRVYSVLDISDFHIKVHGRPVQCDKTISLQKLVMINLNKHLLKTKGLTMSNWDLRPLTTRQMNYAICDALVLLRLYDVLSVDCSDKFENGNMMMLSLLHDVIFE